MDLHLSDIFEIASLPRKVGLAGAKVDPVAVYPDARNDQLFAGGNVINRARPATADFDEFSLN